MTGRLMSSSPYPGLRPFRREESELFFGREECIAAMVDRLSETRFLAVLGASGSGKSSLVRVGLIEALERGEMYGVQPAWRIVHFKPQGRPLRELAHAIAGRDADPQQIELMLAYLRRGPRSLVEWCDSGQLRPGENLLVFVDQFEELFRYRTYAGREEAEAFVALLLASRNETRLPIYVTLTMRSEFLGACALIDGLAEAMNNGQFLTPQMTREQCRAAIVGPSRVREFQVEEALVTRLLNDLATYSASDEHLVREAPDGVSFSDVSSQSDRFARKADQLPLLQHALNGLYSWTHLKAPGERVALKLADYDRWGGLRGALDRHADEILAEIERELGEARAQEIAAKMFRALISGTSPADAQRRPVRFGDLVKLCGGDEWALRIIIEAFRKAGRDFLTPDSSQTITADSIIDVSHESLIRQWSKLSGWLEAEAEDAQAWRRLSDAASDERRGVGGLLRNPSLQTLLQWRNKANPTPVWAERYGTTPHEFSLVNGFLDRSNRAQRWRIVVLAGSVLFGLLVFGAGVWKLNDIELKQKLAATEAARQRDIKINEAEQARLEAQKKVAEQEQESLELQKRAATQEQERLELEKRAAAQEQELVKANRERSTRQAELSTELFRTTSQLFITTAQRDSQVDRWEESGSFIASLIDAVPDSNLQRLLQSLQGRMVAQYAFRTPHKPVGGTALRTDHRGRFRMLLFPGDEVAIVDSQTGTEDRRFDVQEFGRVDAEAMHSVSPDGTSALIFVSSDERFQRGPKAISEQGSLVLVTSGTRRARSTQVADQIGRLDSMAVDWSNRRATWIQWRNQGAEILSLAFNSYGRVGIICKNVAELTFNSENSIKPFMKYPNCGRTEEQKEASYRVTSLANDTAIVEVRYEAEDAKSKLLAVNLSTGRTRQILESRTNFIVAANLERQLKSTTEGPFSAVVTRVPLGGCLSSGVELAKRPITSSQNLETCLHFVDNRGGRLLDGPGWRLPSFESEKAYGPIRFRLIEPGMTIVLDFGERPNRWSVPVTREILPIPSFTPTSARQLGSASTTVLQWSDARSAFAEQIDWRGWQYSAEEHLLRWLSVDGSSIQLSAVQIKPDVSGVVSKRQVSKVPDLDARKLRIQSEDVPWLLPQNDGKVYFAIESRLYELNVVGSESRPDLAKPDVAADLAQAASLGPCRREDANRQSIQRIIEWPRRADFLLLLDRSGGLWKVSPRARRMSSERPERALLSAAVQQEGMGVDPENLTAKGMDCIARSNLNSPIVAVDPTGSRLLLQTDKWNVKALELQASSEPTKVETINEAPFDDEVVAATFVDPDRIAVLLRKGSLLVYTSKGGRWVPFTLSDVGFALELDKSAVLLSSRQKLLVVANSSAIILDLSGSTELPVIAAGKLPGLPSYTKALGLYDDLTIDVLSSGQLMRLRLPAVPSPAKLAEALSARYPLVEGAQYKIIQLQTRIDSSESATSSRLKRLGALDDESRCRILLRALFAPDQSNPDLDPSQKVALRRETRDACANQSAQSWLSDAASLGLEQTSSPWPRTASNTLRALEAGDVQAARALAGWLSNEVRGPGVSGPDSPGNWRGLFEKVLKRENEGNDSELLRIEELSEPGDRTAQEILPGELLNSLDPRVHERLGDKFRAANDPITKRAALFRYSLAETLDAALRDDESVGRVGRKRASIARSLSPEDISGVRDDLANWKSWTSKPTSSTVAVNDDETRLRDDLQIIARLSEAPEHEKENILFAEIASRIAATSRLGKGHSVVEARRQFALLIGRHDRPLRDGTAQMFLDEWFSEFEKDQRFAARVLARVLSAMEKERSEAASEYDLDRTADLTIYRKILELSTTNLRAIEPAAFAKNDVIALNRKVFGYGTIDGADKAQMIAAALAFRARDELINVLLDVDPNNFDYWANRGVGRFWLGVAAARTTKGDRRDGVKAVGEISGPKIANLQNAIADLKKAREMGDTNLETLYRLVDAQRWIVTDATERNQLTSFDLFSESISQYSILADAIRDHKWIAWPSSADVLSQYASLLRTASSHCAELSAKLETRWRAGEDVKESSASLVLDSIQYSSIAHRVAREARDVDGVPFKNEAGWNFQYAYSLSLLANQLEVQFSSAADPCDKAASHPFDALKQFDGVTFEEFRDLTKFERAKSACELSKRTSPNSPRMLYLLGRVLSSSDDKQELIKGRELLGEAASRGYVMAFNNVASALPNEEARFRQIYVQHVLSNHFATVFSYLWPRKRNEKDKEALLWLAERAAELGVSEAHEALADAATDPEKKKFHLLTGARFARGATKTRLDAKADRISLSPEADKRARAAARQFERVPIDTISARDKEKLKQPADAS